MKFIPLCKLLQKYCGELQNKSLLDVGCGIGDLLAAAQGAFKRCVGSEFSEHLRKFAHEKTKLNILEASALTLEFKIVIE